jgi:DNA-directed RNA polymerase subunit RPC12/RpoP
MERQFNCPYCGRTFLVKTDLNISDLYIFPNQTRYWEPLFNTFNKNEYFVKEADCPYCNRRFTILGLTKPLKEFKRPPIMRFFLLKVSLAIFRWNVDILVIPLSLFFAMLWLYHTGVLPVSFLLAVLLISIVFLHRAIKTFRSFDVFGSLPIGTL